MIKIFAKYGTDEKVLVVCQQQEVRRIQILLSENYGGDWLWVDNVYPGEILKFSDGLSYHGFHGKDERYCCSIKEINF